MSRKPLSYKLPNARRWFEISLFGQRRNCVFLVNALCCVMIHCNMRGLSWFHSY